MAFTIRAWSRRTLRQTFLQGMECQPGTRSGAAPASVAAADISALLPESVGQGSLVTEDQREVCRLSPGVMSPGGSTPIRSITGRPSLAPSSCTRRPIGFSCESLSLRGDDGLTTFRRGYAGGLGRASPPGVRRLRRRSSEPPDLTPYLFGPSDAASCACPCDDV